MPTPTPPQPFERAALAAQLRPHFQHLRALEVARGGRFCLADIARGRLIPRGAWSLLGAQKPRPATVRWHRLGCHPSGQQILPGCLHLVANDRRHTICGREIPSPAADLAVYWHATGADRCTICERRYPMLGCRTYDQEVR